MPFHRSWILATLVVLSWGCARRSPGPSDPRYVLLSTGADDSRWYVDSRTLAATNAGTVVGWVTVQKPKQSFFQSLSTSSRLEFDCSAQRFRLVDASGAVAAWQAISPGSISEEMRAGVCATKRQTADTSSTNDRYVEISTEAGGRTYYIDKLTVEGTKNGTIFWVVTTDEKGTREQAYRVETDCRSWRFRVIDLGGTPTAWNAPPPESHAERVLIVGCVVWANSDNKSGKPRATRKRAAASRRTTPTTVPSQSVPQMNPGRKEI